MKAFFVLGNAGHHAAMMTPVMRELVGRGHAVDVLSVAELRGLPAPRVDVPGVQVRALFPKGVRKSKGASAFAKRAAPDPDGLGRKVAREVMWRTTLGPALRWHMLWLPDVVVLPNDVAFPYDRIRAVAQERGVRTVLVQEGIRFPLPVERQSGAAYGSAGCTRLCAWGEASADHFASAGAARATIAVTGNPRFDDVDVEGLRAIAGETRARHALSARTLLYLSNPVDDQGFATTDEKMRLFADLLRRAAPILEERDAMIAVKLHPREDVAAFRRTAASSPAAARVRVLDDAALHPLLAAGHAAIVLSSTVGLEALLFGLPLGVVALPGYGPVHDYVEAGAAERLDIDDRLPQRLRALLGDRQSVAPEVRAAYVERHLAHRGDAAHRIADEILRTVASLIEPINAAATSITARSPV